MTDPLEQEIRAAFVRQAGEAPSADGVVGRMRVRVRHRARVRAALVLVAVLPLAAAGAGVAASVSSGSGDRAPDVSAQPVITGTGAVPDAAGKSSLGFVYDLTDFPPRLASVPGTPVEEVWFAVDATVTEIGPGPDTRAGKPLPPMTDNVSVTLEVHEWFTDGAGDTLVVNMDSPNEPGAGWFDDYRPPAFGVGTRLLVSGARGWSDGSFGEDALAWGSGFTRYYDAETADAWREVLEPLR